MKKNHLKQEDFAAKIGVSQGTLSRYINGSRFPTPNIFLSIYKITDGQVTPNDFYNIGTAEDMPSAAVPADEPKGKGNA